MQSCWVKLLDKPEVSYGTLYITEDPERDVRVARSCCLDKFAERIDVSVYGRIHGFVVRRDSAIVRLYALRSSSDRGASERRSLARGSYWHGLLIGNQNPDFFSPCLGKTNDAARGSDTERHGVRTRRRYTSRTRNKVGSHIVRAGIETDQMTAAGHNPNDPFSVDGNLAW